MYSRANDTVVVVVANTDVEDARSISVQNISKHRIIVSIVIRMVLTNEVEE